MKVYTPFKAFTSFSDTAVCTGDTLQLTANPTGERITWSPAIGLSSTNMYNPMAYPAQSTNYQAILTDSFGCFSDTVQENIVIKSSPTVNAGADAAYPYHSSFSLQPTYSPNVVSYEWSPSASLSCSTCSVPDGGSRQF